MIKLKSTRIFLQKKTLLLVVFDEPLVITRAHINNDEKKYKERHKNNVKVGF